MAASPRAVATGNRPCNNDAQTHQMASDLIRVLVTAWLLALTGILLAYSYWAGRC